MDKKITLKALVVTFNDNATPADVDSVCDLLLHYKGQARFTVQETTQVEEVPDDTEAKHGKKG